MLVKKKKLTEPPTERKTQKSRALSNQTSEIEEVLESAPRQKQTFTEWAKNNNVESTDHKKSLWKKSGGTLTNEEKNNFTDTDTYNNENTVNNFIDSDLNERNTVLDNASQTQQSLESNLTETMETPIRTGSNWKMDVARGVHPQNLILGYLSDLGAKSVMDNYVDKALPNQGEFMKTAERGGIAGTLTATALGSAVLPEAIAGAGAYVAQKYSTEGIYKGLKAVGASDDVAGVSASTVGGAVGGGTAGLLGSLALGATTGAEEGAVAGGGIFSAETGAIGAGIGALVGLGSYAWGKIHG